MTNKIMNTITTVTQPQGTATTVEALARKRDIPEEWIRANCIREKDCWHLVGSDSPINRYLDNPEVDEKGKAKKYKLLPGSTPDLWVCKIPDGFPNPYEQTGDGGGWIIITEGEFKVMKACSEGIPTVGISGVTNWSRKDEKGKRVLCTTLQEFVDGGEKRFTVAFDADASTNPNVREETIKLAKALIAAGCEVRIATGQWTVEEGKGMDDFISKNGVEAMRERLERALTLEAFEATYSVSRKGKGSKKKSLIDTVRKYFDGKLKYNEMTGYCELNGKMYNPDLLDVVLADKGICEIDPGLAIRTAEHIARENSYHPFVDYLGTLKGRGYVESNATVPALKGFPTSPTQMDYIDYLNEVWGRIFGNITPIEKTYLTKTFVGAVARVLQPGCDMQSMLILLGAQGTRKSTFCKEVAGSQYYTNSYRGTIEKDDLLKLHSAVFHEIAEFDKIYSKTDTATLKDIITSPIDAVRPPYGRTTIPMERRSILMGTTNRWDILHDPTGSRRFWVVHVTQKLDTSLLVQERDNIWTALQALYESGYQWHLNEMEDVQRELMNANYQEVDPYRDAVESYCFPDGRESKGLPTVCWEEIHEWHYGKENVKPATQQEQRKYLDALRQFGYEPNGNSNRKTFGGKRVKTWSLILPPPCDSSVTGTSLSGQERSHTGQPCPVSVSTISDRLTPTFQTFGKNDVVENLAPIVENATQNSEKVSFKGSDRSQKNEVLECSADKDSSLTAPLTAPDRSPSVPVSVPLDAREVKVGDTVRCCDPTVGDEWQNTDLKVVMVKDTLISVIHSSPNSDSPKGTATRKGLKQNQYQVIS